MADIRDDDWAEETARTTKTDRNEHAKNARSGGAVSAYKTCPEKEAEIASLQEELKTLRKDKYKMGWREAAAAEERIYDIEQRLRLIWK